MDTGRAAADMTGMPHGPNWKDLMERVCTAALLSAFVFRFNCFDLGFIHLAMIVM